MNLCAIAVKEMYPMQGFIKVVYVGEYDNDSDILHNSVRFVEYLNVEQPQDPRIKPVYTIELIPAPDPVSKINNQKFFPEENILSVDYDVNEKNNPKVVFDYKEAIKYNELTIAEFNTSKNEIEKQQSKIVKKALQFNRSMKRKMKKKVKKRK